MVVMNYNERVNYVILVYCRLLTTRYWGTCITQSGLQKKSVLSCWLIVI